MKKKFIKNKKDIEYESYIDYKVCYAIIVIMMLSLTIQFLVYRLIDSTETKKGEQRKYQVADERKKLVTQEVEFYKCVDGDTAKFIIQERIESVRFLAIDTPETVNPNAPIQPYGKEASNYTCQMLKDAESIVLEYESNETYDKYERRLAWVFIDDNLIQSKLLQEGLANIRYTKPSYKYLSLLDLDQAIAQKEKKGIWNNE